MKIINYVNLTVIFCTGQFSIIAGQAQWGMTMTITIVYSQNYDSVWSIAEI